MVILNFSNLIINKRNALVVTDCCQSARTVQLALNRLKVDMNLYVRSVIVCGDISPEWERSISGMVPGFFKYSNSRELIEKLNEIISGEDIEVVVDLSGEPELSWDERIKLAGITINTGAIYLGSDFLFLPPEYKKIPDYRSSISIYGIGKRVGKTSLTCQVVNLLNGLQMKPVVITMSRKGPHYARIVNPEQDVIDFLYLVKRDMDGEHATADYLEISAITGAVTIGCSRIGGGFAGVPFTSLVVDGALMATDINGDYLIFEGSGDTIPPIETNKSIFIISSDCEPSVFNLPFYLHRLDRADIVIVTGLQKSDLRTKRVKDLMDFIENYKKDIKVYPTTFSSRIKGDITGGKWLLLTTADAVKNEKIKNELEKDYSCKIVGMSSSLSHKDELENELKVLYEKHKPDGLIMELKGNAIKSGGKLAIMKNIEVVFLYSELVSLKRDVNLDEELTKYVIDIEGRIEVER